MFDWDMKCGDAEKYDNLMQEEQEWHLVSGIQD